MLTICTGQHNFLTQEVQLGIFPKKKHAFAILINKRSDLIYRVGLPSTQRLEGLQIKEPYPVATATKQVLVALGGVNFIEEIRMP